MALLWNHDSPQWYDIVYFGSHGFALEFSKRPRTNGDSIPHLYTHDYSLN